MLTFDLIKNSKIKNKKSSRGFILRKTRFQQNFLSVKGFTLIELLVVMAIIGTLATLFVANFNAARQRARDAARKSDVHNIETALRLYKNDNGSYPTSDSSNRIVGCGGSACLWGDEWTNNGVTYMKELPGDPLPSRSYRYIYVNADDYTLLVCLENRSDDQCLLVGDWCATGCIYSAEP